MQAPRIDGAAAADARDELILFPPPEPAALLPPAQWAIYSAVMAQTRAAGVPFALGGGLAVSCYTGLWRPTRDLDLYLQPADREAAIAATARAGLADYFPQKPYDRSWIYRATAGEGVIVDIIWAMANGAGEVGRSWIEAGPGIDIQGERVPLVPPEEMIVSKLHVLQRDRSDWPDLVNLFYACGPALQWPRLLALLADEARLLGAALLVFSWVAPGRARALPDWIWARLGLARPEDGPPHDAERVRRLDTREWFAGGR